MKLFDNFLKARLLVIGDVMLDRYWWGDVTRISPEAPVPVVRLRRDTYVPGGAANVAVNVAGLGAEVTLLGLVGSDPEGESLRKSLVKNGVSPENLIESSERPTNTKTRVIAHNQQVVRVDREITSGLSEIDNRRICDSLPGYIANSDVVLLSDYAKGTLSDPVLLEVLKGAREAGKLVIVDPKGKNFSKYRGASVLTPNRQEAADASGFDPESDGLVPRAGSQLLADLDLAAILITESEEGMTLFEKGREPLHYAAAAKEVYDVTGAGDTVIATMAVALAAGSGFPEAARLANIAAGIVVQQLGTASISREKLASSMADASAA